eukprot:g3321.t1
MSDFFSSVGSLSKKDASQLGNLSAIGHAPALPTRTVLRGSMSSLTLEGPGVSRNAKQRYRPFLSSQFTRSKAVIKDHHTFSISSVGGHAVDGGQGNAPGTLMQDDTVLKELALLRKKYKNLKKDYKHMKATVAELEFTNKSQARVLQHQQASIVKQSQRNMRMTRVLAAMPRQEYEKIEQDPSLFAHPSVIIRRGGSMLSSSMPALEPLDAPGGSAILDGDLGGNNASGLSGQGLPTFNPRKFLPKHVDERSLGSNNKMYRNALSAIARDKESLHKKYVSLQRKNEKIKRTTVKMMEQIRSLKKRLVEAKSSRFSSAASDNGGRNDSALRGHHLREIESHLADMSVNTQIKHMERDLFGLTDKEQAQLQAKALQHERVHGADNADQEDPKKMAQKIMSNLLDGGPKLKRDSRSLKSRRQRRRGTLVDTMMLGLEGVSTVRRDDVSDSTDQHGSATATNAEGALVSQSGGSAYFEAKEKVMMKMLRDLEDMLEICIEMSLCETQEEVMGLMESHVKTLVSVDRATLYIIDHSTETIWTKFATGVPPIKMPMSKGISGWVAKHAKSAYIPDAYADGRFDPRSDTASGYRTHNMLCVPVFNSDERCVAVLQAINKMDAESMPTDFTTQDKVLIHLLGRHMGVVLQELIRADTLRRGLSKLTELVSVSRNLCSVNAGTRRDFDVIRLAQRAEETAKEILDTSYARVLFLEHRHVDQQVKIKMFGEEAADPESGKRKLWYVTQEISTITFKQEPTRKWAATTSGISGYVVTTGRSVDVEHPEIDDRYHAAQDLNTHSLGLLSVPLLSPITNSPIGVLQISNRRRTASISESQRTNREKEVVREFAQACNWYASQLAMTFELFQLVNVERNTTLDKNFTLLKEVLKRHENSKAVESQLDLPAEMTSDIESNNAYHDQLEKAASFYELKWKTEEYERKQREKAEAKAYLAKKQKELAEKRRLEMIAKKERDEKEQDVEVFQLEIEEVVVGAAQAGVAEAGVAEAGVAEAGAAEVGAAEGLAVRKKELEEKAKNVEAEVEAAKLLQAQGGEVVGDHRQGVVLEEQFVEEVGEEGCPDQIERIAMLKETIDLTNDLESLKAVRGMIDISDGPGFATLHADVSAKIDQLEGSASVSHTDEGVVTVEEFAPPIQEPKEDATIADEPTLPIEGQEEVATTVDEPAPPIEGQEEVVTTVDEPAPPIEGQEEVAATEEEHAADADEPAPPIEGQEEVVTTEEEHAADADEATPPIEGQEEVAATEEEHAADADEATPPIE